MLFAVFLLSLGIVSAQDRGESQACVNSATCSWNPRRQWGQYSPYSPAPSTLIKKDVPPGCKVTFASVLSRHGSRFPTEEKRETYRELLQRIQENVRMYGRGYGFIKEYDIQILEENDLTVAGKNEMIQSGIQFFKRYENLAWSVLSPFVRVSGSDAILDSAHSFIRGFFYAKRRNPRPHLSNVLIISEEDDAKNPLNHGTCKGFEDGLKSELLAAKKNAWLNIWAPSVMTRLNRKMPGANLTLEETVYIMDLCPLITAASTKRELSPFCRLFSKREWLAYDYYQTQVNWYTYGPGNPMASTQGVGYVNELIARLTGYPVEDETSTDPDLDGDSDTFPLDRNLYADFAYDSTLMTVYGALGLWTDESVTLPSNRMVSASRADGYSATWTVPFAARMYVEKMDCDKDGKDLVRVLVNERVVVPKGCKADALGRCTLEEFVNGLQFARQGGHWNQC
ncbi:hypothetical protein E4U35_005658 [Claviceps purpurea]|nr:hypothetical protein E4U27_000417 [Claviceps purpurea]KAG6201683.1 hypothetical protein E4U35_005658 [Claviceps purpurea]